MAVEDCGSPGVEEPDHSILPMESQSLPR